MRDIPPPKFTIVVNEGEKQPCVICKKPTVLGFVFRGRDLGRDTRLCSEECAQKQYNLIWLAEQQAQEAAIRG